MKRTIITAVASALVLIGAVAGPSNAASTAGYQTCTTGSVTAKVTGTGNLSVTVNGVKVASTSWYPYDTTLVNKRAGVKAAGWSAYAGSTINNTKTYGYCS